MHTLMTPQAALGFLSGRAAAGARHRTSKPSAPVDRANVTTAVGGPPARRLGLSALAGLIAAGSFSLAACAKSEPDDWPARPQAAAKGQFAVVQFATLDPDGLQAQWARAAPGAKVRTTHEVRLGQSFSNFINFKNCRPDPNGECQVTTNWRLVAPDGVVTATAETRVSVSRPPPRQGAIGLSSESLDLVFNPPDPPGNYVVHASTTDHVAGVTLETRDPIKLLP